MWRSVLLVIVLCILNNTLLAKKKNNQTCKKSFAQLVFSNRAKFNIWESSNNTASCKWLQGCKPQRQVCWKNRGLSEILRYTRKLAVKYCETHYRYVQWNCSAKMRYFKNIFRETAYMQALSSAALMYSVSISCAEGNFPGCGCGAHSIRSPGSDWQWGGCADNIRFGKMFAKRFLQLEKNEDSQHQIYKLNSEIGFHAIKVNMELRCRCHGVSGSCSVKTCWKSIRKFDFVAKHLKDHYHSAILIESSNTFRHSTSNKNSKRLLFLKQTPSFCSSTTGRECSDTDNCATLCCGRGTYNKTVPLVYPSECRWRGDISDVICKPITKDEIILICK